MTGLRDQARKAARAEGDDEKRHRDRRHTEAKEWAAKALGALLELDADDEERTVKPRRLRKDDHPAVLGDRPSFGLEHEGLRFIARPVADGADLAGLGGYRVFVLIGEKEHRVDGLAALGELLKEE